MGRHSKEDLQAIHNHVEDALQGLVSNLAKDKLCLMCALQELILLSMVNHMMHGLLTQAEPKVTPLGLIAYTDHVFDQFADFVMTMDANQTAVRIQTFTSDGEPVPEKKSQH